MEKKCKNTPTKRTKERRILDSISSQQQTRWMQIQNTFEFMSFVKSQWMACVYHSTYFLDNNRKLGTAAKRNYYFYGFDKTFVFIICVNKFFIIILHRREFIYWIDGFCWILYSQEWVIVRKSLILFQSCLEYLLATAPPLAYQTFRPMAIVVVDY